MPRSWGSIASARRRLRLPARASHGNSALRCSKRGPSHDINLCKVDFNCLAAVPLDGSEVERASERLWTFCVHVHACEAVRACIRMHFITLLRSNSGLVCETCLAASLQTER